MIEEIKTLLGCVAELKAENEEQLEQLRLEFLSKKGKVNQLVAEFRNVAADQKKEVGIYLNQLKTALQDRFNTLKQELATTEDDHSALDLTRTPYPITLGTRHPLSLVKQEIIDIFGRMGFSLADGPEIEDDWHVFGAMNFAEDHPARDMQDTFFVETHPDVILRTHTSSVQSRVMEHTAPPIRVICPGRVYRNEAISARAHCFFHQVEGLYIDKDVSFTDLKQVLLAFARLTSPSQSLLPKWTFPATSAAARVAASANTPVGWRSWAAVWSTRRYLRRTASIRRCTRVMLSVWVWSASRT